MMTREKLIAELRKELASKEALIKSKDETISAKDDHIVDLRRQLAASRVGIMGKLVAFAAAIWAAIWRTGQTASSPNDEVRRPRRREAKAPDAAVKETKPPDVPIRSNRGEVRSEATVRPYLPRRAKPKQQKKRQERKQMIKSTESFSPAPHDALVTEDTMSRALSFLGLKDYATGARTCRAWSQAAKSVDNISTYWRDVARSRWPDWAATIEAEMGTKYNFKSACKEKLRDEDHRLVEAWEERTIPSFIADEYGIYNFDVPRGVPKISWLSHQGHVSGSLDALSVLSHNDNIPAPIFKRYENAAVAMYADRSSSCRGFKDLLPVPTNLSERRRSDHNYSRSIVKAIFFKADGSLMDEKPEFSYRNEVALYFAGTYEKLSPTQILSGVVQLRSTVGAVVH